MIAIIGLGNPGEKYKENRHNAGYMFIDYFLQNQNDKAKFKSNKYTQSEEIKITLKNQTFLLVKPLTFMNLSGQAVKKLTKIYGLKSSDFIIVHDDLDIPLGKFKIQKGIGPKLHNGLESIENSLGTKNFWRVRIGVDNRSVWMNGETYVLRNFTPEEKEIAVRTFPKIYSKIHLTSPNMI